MTSVRESILARSVRLRFLRSIPTQGRVLDAGCGTGYNALPLHAMAPAAEIYGVDLLDPSAVPAFIHYARLDLEVEKLPFPDGWFDAVILSHVLEHLQKPLACAAELSRVLKPGGRIYVEAPNWTSLFVPSWGFHRGQHHAMNFFDDPTHVKPWSKQGLFEFLSTYCGLTVESVGTVRNWVRIPFDLPRIAWGVLTGRRNVIVPSVWNLCSWSIYAIGRKE